MSISRAKGLIALLTRARWIKLKRICTWVWSRGCALVWGTALQALPFMYMSWVWSSNNYKLSLLPCRMPNRWQVTNSAVTCPQCEEAWQSGEQIYSSALCHVSWWFTNALLMHVYSRLPPDRAVNKHYTGVSLTSLRGLDSWKWFLVYCQWLSTTKKGQSVTKGNLSFSVCTPVHHSALYVPLSFNRLALELDI